MGSDEEIIGTQLRGRLTGSCPFRYDECLFYLLSLKLLRLPCKDTQLVYEDMYFQELVEEK